MSKKFIVLLSTSLLLFTACGGGEKDKKDAADTKTAVSTEVKPFVSKEGKFSISFPGEPEVAIDPIAIGDGSSINMTSFTYQPNEKSVFLLAYADYPVASIEKIKARDVIKNVQSGNLSSFGIDKAEEEKEVDYGDSPGLLYRAGKSGSYLVSQIYLVGNRLYQIELLSETSYPTDEQVKAFIDSFKLL